MKKLERLKSRIKIKFKYFILARILTLFFAMVFLLPTGGQVALAESNFFDFNQESPYSEPFSKLIEFLNDKKNELEKMEKYDGDFLGAKSFLSPAEEEGGNNNSSLSADEINPAVSSFASAVFESVKSFVVDNPKQYFGTVFESVKNFVFPGDSQNSFEYNSPSSEENAKEIENLKQQYAEAIDETKAISQNFNLLQNELEKIKNSGVVVRQPIVEQKVVERTIERIVSGQAGASGLSQGVLDSKISEIRTELQNLNTNLLNQINNLSVQSNQQTSAVYQAVSLTNKIDSLTNTTLTTPTISNPTITGTLTNQTLSNSGNASIGGTLGVSGLSTLANSTTTNATITDNFWSNGSTRLFGGQAYIGDEDSDALTIRSGVWSLTSTATSTAAMTNGLNFDSNTFVIDPNSNRVGVGTSTPQYTLDVDGNIRATGLVIANGQTIGGDFSITGNATLGDATTTDITYFNSRIADSLIPTADNLLDLGDSANWLRWRTGYFGTSVGIGGTATSTGTQLTTSGAYLIDSNNTLSINTTNNKAVSFGTGNVSLPYASSTALTVSGSAYIGSLNGPLQANNGLVSATTSVGSIYGGTGLDSSALTGIAQIVSGTWSASSTLSTAFGGTGWNSIQANSILLGNGAGRIATTSAGTDGYVLALSNGVPTWLATSTLSTITGTLSVAKGGTGQTSFGQGWLHSDGTTFTSSTSPTVAYITATSTTATSTFAGGMSVAGTAGLTVLQNGNVGVGTTSPYAKLSVAGFINTDGVVGGFKIDNNIVLQASSTNTSLAVGIGAGAALLSDGSGNTVIGHQALNVATSTDHNTAVGYRALYATTEGNQNTAVGFNALSSNTMGRLNTAFGEGALSANTISNSNTAFGFYSGLNSTGSSNTFLGYQAGYNMTTGSNNLIIGFNIDAPSNTASNQLNIGNLIYGTGIDGTGTTLSSGNVGIGTTSPYAKLSVVGETVSSYFTATTTTASTFPYASTTALTVSGSAYLTGLGQGWLHTAGGVNALSASTSPTVNYITATSTTATSTFAGGMSVAGTAGLTVLQNGNVGVGTAAPSSKLHIVGSGTNQFPIKVDGFNSGIFRINDGTYDYDVIGAIGNDLYFGYQQANMYFRANSGTQMTIYNNGNVGIGTTTPGYRLSVNATDGTTNLFQVATTTNQGIMVINSAGNVGIGTTGPDATLQVVGNVNIGSNPGNAPLTDLDIQDDGETSVRFNRKSVSGYRLGIPSTGSVFLIEGSSSGQALGSGILGMAITTTGNVGIGTTSPYAKLSVEQGSEENVFAVSDQGTSTPSFIVKGNGNVGIGTAAPGTKLTTAVNNTTGTNDQIELSVDAWETNERHVIKWTSSSGTVLVGRFGMDFDGVATNFVFRDMYNGGVGSTEIMRIGGTGNVGIGTTSPYAKLSVVGETVSSYFTATSTTATSTFNGDINFGIASNLLQGGQRFLTSSTTAAGNLTLGYQSAAGLDANGGLYNTGVGYQALGNATSTSYNTALGYQALLGSATIPSSGYNTAVGYQALSTNTTGNQNTANGYQSLANNTTGGSNTAVGYRSLYLNTTGNDNTANGHRSLTANTTGSSNTANGMFSLFVNTTGSFNAAYGNMSLASNTTGGNNTANGHQSLYSNTTGGNNTANGWRSLFSNTTGSDNTANGYRSGMFIADGSTSNATSTTSVYLGADTKALADGDTNEIVIGYNATGVGSNSAVLGNDSITKTILKGSVGIGTTSPYAKLSVVGETVSTYFTATTTTKSTFPYASTTALTISGSAYIGSLNGPLQANNGLVSATTSVGVQYGGTGQTSFGQGWLNSNGTDLSASTSPTVNYLTATSTTATSTFAGGMNVAGSSGLTVLQNGNVGIGTSTPLSKLAVSGGLSVGADYNIAAPTNGAIIQGNVGIGTTNPGAKLEINGGASAVTGIKFSNFINGSTKLLDFSGTGLEGNADYLIYMNASNNWTAGGRLYASNLQSNYFQDPSARTRMDLSGNDTVIQAVTIGEVARFTTAGNVGIGTTSPYAKLSVVGPVVAEYFHATSTTATSTFAGGMNVAGTAGLTVLQNGNVGVGTAGPTYKLQVSGSGYFAGTLSLASNLAVEGNLTTMTGNPVRFTSSLYTTDNTTMRFGDSYDYSIGYNSTDDTLQFVDGETLGTNVRLSLNSSGNVGIGTTSPYAKLSVVGPVVAEYFHATSTTATSTFAGGMSVAGTAGLTVLQNGNVGIGTVTPGAKLQVAGDIAIDATRKIYFDGGGDTYIIESSTDNVQFTVGGALKQIIDNEGTTFNNGNVGDALAVSEIATVINPVWSFRSDSDTGIGWGGADSLSLITGGNSRIYINSSGNVGIGTTSPYAKLSVVGPVVAEYFHATSTTATSTFGGFIDVLGTGSNATSTFSGNLWVKGTLRAAVSYVGDLIFANNFRFTEADPILTGSNALYLQNQFGSTTLAVDENGNVGIGTTSPAYKLHVLGDIAATSFVNTSTRDAKKDINYLNSSQESDFLNKIKNTNIANYHYSIENQANPLRLGLIAEEAPAEILSVDGKGVDVYKMATFTLGGVKALQKEIEKMKIDIAALSAGAGGAISGSDSLFTWITDKFKTALGIGFEQGKLCLEDVCVNKAQLKELLEKNNISQTSSSSSEAVSSSSSSESSSASSTSDVLPSQSLPAGEAGSSSTSDVIPAASSSSSSSSDTSSSSSSEVSSSESSSSVSSSSEASSSSSSNI